MLCHADTIVIVFQKLENTCHTLCRYFDHGFAYCLRATVRGKGTVCIGIIRYPRMTEVDSFTFAIPALSGKDYTIEVLDATGSSAVFPAQNGLQATFPRERSYLFAKIVTK